MFDRYFGKKVEYKEVFIDNDGYLSYRAPVSIDGSVISASGGSHSSEWLSAKSTKSTYRYRVRNKLNIGDIIDGSRVLGCVPKGFGSRIDFYIANTVKYDNFVITKEDMTMICLVEHLIGSSEMNNSPIFSSPETVKTFKTGQKELFRNKGDGTIEAVSANCYVFLGAYDVKSGDKIDGYIVNEVIEYHSVDGELIYKEAFVCK